MPSVEPPPTDNVRDWILYSEEETLLEKVVKSRPKKHEVQYIRDKYRYEEFRYVAHQVFENPARRGWFLIRNFNRARWEAGIQLGAHIIVAVIMILFIFA